MRKQLIALVVLVFAAAAAHAADKVKVGFVSTLSGPSSALGVDIRDGFLLAVKLNGGKLGGLPAEVLVSDDQFKPDVAQAAVREERQARQGRFHDRRGVLQHHAGRAARGARQQHHLHQPERRRRRRWPARTATRCFFARRLAERRVPRGGGPVRQHARPEERLPAGAELPGRQGLARRLQAHLQGPGDRRELHQARPARLRRRARRDPRRQAAGACTSSCPAAWASTSSSSSSAPASARTSSCCCPASAPTRT